jgi:hypothetical protein
MHVLPPGLFAMPCLDLEVARFLARITFYGQLAKRLLNIRFVTNALEGRATLAYEHLKGERKN